MEKKFNDNVFIIVNLIKFKNVSKLDKRGLGGV